MFIIFIAAVSQLMQTFALAMHRILRKPSDKIASNLHFFTYHEKYPSFEQNKIDKSPE